MKCMDTLFPKKKHLYQHVHRLSFLYTVFNLLHCLFFTTKLGLTKFLDYGTTCCDQTE
jgi:hypothetical protein